ncbi:MAG: gliding motility-associated C-terminal domain-containing protein, partial [Bacteroidia bacterium]|nr:gliding motility-associated C-terminal domain-containing protein [Bacteroidia bacterium]
MRFCLIFLLFIKISVSQNLVVNGDFNSGNTGFFTNYTYCNTGNCLFPYVDNAYSVGPNPNFFHSVFAGHDHTTGTGNMMIFNGGVASYSAWSQTVIVLPSQTYSLSIWACSVYTNNIAKLNFAVNGVSVGTLTPSSSVNIWTQFSITWNSNANTSAVIRINSLNTSGSNAGVDFGLDDISFTPINITPTSQFSANTQTICSGQSVNFNNTSINATSYSWNFGDSGTSSQQNPNHIYTTPNVYTVSLTSFNGTNTATSNQTITVLPSPTLSVSGNTIICSGNSTTLNGNGANAYSWSNGVTTASINLNPSVTTSYSLVGTSNTCTNIAVVTVSVNPSPILTSVNITNTSCGLNNGAVSILATPSNNTYSWSAGVSSTNVAVNLAPGNYTVTAINNSCQTSTVVTILGSQSLLMSISGNTLICNGNSTLLNSSPANTYSWSNGVVTQSVNLNPLVTTTYSLTGTSNTCTNTAVVTVSVLTAPVVILSPNTTICQGISSSVTLTAGGANSYVWSNASSLSGSTGTIVTASPGVTTTYTVTGTIGLCTNTAIVTVSVNPSPAITSVNISNTSCGLNNGSATITATPSNNIYSWSGGVSSTINSAGGLSSGNYTVSAINGACQSSTVITILSSVPLSITSVSVTPSNCNLNNGVISIVDNLINSNYSWSPGISSTSNTINNLSPGSYSLIITNGSCVTTTIIPVGITVGPTAINVLIKDANCKNDSGSVQITNVVNGTPPYQYNLNNSGFSSITSYTNLSQGIYTITIKDINTCTYTQTISIAQTTVNLIADIKTITPKCFENDGAFVIENITGGTFPYLVSFNNTSYTPVMVFDSLSPGTYTLEIIDSDNCETNFILTMLPNDGDYTLYIPNTFTPNHDSVNDVWYIQGTCLGAIKCLIYNRWGEKI